MIYSRFTTFPSLLETYKETYKADKDKEKELIQENEIITKRIASVNVKIAILLFYIVCSYYQGHG
jgi:hypothetical protein